MRVEVEVTQTTSHLRTIEVDEQQYRDLLTVINVERGDPQFDLLAEKLRIEGGDRFTIHNVIRV